jgi:hypothetical protein
MLHPNARSVEQDWAACQFLKVIGGPAILSIAVGLFREEPPLESSATHPDPFQGNLKLRIDSAEAESA